MFIILNVITAVSPLDILCWRKQVHSPSSEQTRISHLQLRVFPTTSFKVHLNPLM
jgi:hypothetical protein